MNIIYSKPPNYEKIISVLTPPKNAVMTYGDKIYAPFVRGSLAPDLVFHEQTHMMQQGKNPDAWWEKYLEDSQFRVLQELAAYRNQFRYYKDHMPRKYWYDFLETIARDLSSVMYGGVMDYPTAYVLIQQ